MKTSIDLPDELYRRVKARSALEGRAVREVATELLSAWVESTPTPSAVSARESSTSSDSSAEWLYEWEALGVRVAKANGRKQASKSDRTGSRKSVAVKSTSLVAQLRRDRR